MTARVARSSRQYESSWPLSPGGILSATAGRRHFVSPPSVIRVTARRHDGKRRLESRQRHLAIAHNRSRRPGCQLCRHIFQCAPARSIYAPTSSVHFASSRSRHLTATAPAGRKACYRPCDRGSRHDTDIGHYICSQPWRPTAVKRGRCADAGHGPGAAAISEKDRTRVRRRNTLTAQGRQLALLSVQELSPTLHYRKIHHVYSPGSVHSAI